LLARGDITAAHALAGQLRQWIDAQYGEQHLLSLVAGYIEGAASSRMGQLDDAESLLRTSFDQLTAQIGELDPVTLKAGLFLAQHLRDSGQHQASLELAESLFVRSVRRLGQAHFRTVQLQQLVESLNN